MAAHGCLKVLKYIPNILILTAPAVAWEIFTDLRSIKPLRLIHFDLLGSFDVFSVGVARCVTTFVYDFTNWTIEYTILQISQIIICGTDFLRKYSLKNDSILFRNLKSEILTIELVLLWSWDTLLIVNNTISETFIPKPSLLNATSPQQPLKCSIFWILQEEGGIIHQDRRQNRTSNSPCERCYLVIWKIKFFIQYRI